MIVKLMKIEGSGKQIKSQVFTNKQSWTISICNHSSQYNSQERNFLKLFSNINIKKVKLQVEF